MLAQAKTCFCLALPQNQEIRDQRKRNASLILFSTLQKERMEVTPVNQKAKLLLSSPRPISSARFKLTYLIYSELIVVLRSEARLGHEIASLS